MNQGFPSELGAAFVSLWDDVAGLFSRWLMLLQLYGTHERIQLLNSAAPSFFHAVQQSLGDSVILSIARLTDPAQTRTDENLTLERLLLLTPSDQHPQLSADLQLRLNVLTNHCKPIRVLRNRKLAHTDLPTRLNPDAEPVPEVQRKVIQDAIGQIADYMNRIDLYFRGSRTRFEEIIHTGDGDTVALLLETALRERKNAIARKLKLRD